MAEAWTAEVRHAWASIDDEERLAECWLAGLSQVQALAASKYGGRSIGKGRALQELLKTAVSEAQESDTDKKTYRVLLKYPQVTVKKIADELGTSREHLSRHYVSKAARLLARAFMQVLERQRHSSKAL